MTKTTRKKKRSKSEEEKRSRLLEKILDKWVYMKYNDGMEDYYIFMKHRKQNDNSTSKLEQIILSGDELQDGLYLITDYDINNVWDKRTKQYIIELKAKKFDKKTGFDAEEELVESFDELKESLVGAKYLTEEEFFLYCQSTKKPPGIEEVILSFDSYN